MTRNFFHSLGDMLAVVITRVCAAWGALTGKTSTLTIEDIMTAIEQLNTAIANVSTYVGTLKTDFAAVDQTPAIQAAATALEAILPVAPVVADPNAPPA